MYAVVPFLIIFRRLTKWAALGSIAIFFLLAFFLARSTANCTSTACCPINTLHVSCRRRAVTAKFVICRRQFGLEQLALSIALHRSKALCPCNKEVIAGILTGTQALAILKRRHFPNGTNLQAVSAQFAGSLSYGVFLSHFIFIMVFQNIFNQDHYGLWLSIKPVP